MFGVTVVGAGDAVAVPTVVGALIVTTHEPVTPVAVTGIGTLAELPLGKFSVELTTVQLPPEVIE